MPVADRTEAQADLVSEAASRIPDYLVSRLERPSALAETYASSLPVNGTIGAGKTVETRAGTLNLENTTPA